ncbi:MAG: cytochrome c [Xanthomonadales bacterium]|nr:cytochrome c [Gammaproteobacteria bacterium]MBT8056175.1 cytochrome c [Gammaproteobacteria bacterium]NNJ78395.1 cytochrome c [Xanthomonadales bacterium]NNL03646.1 cytochrome c [Xanthomonadales bacterium]
MNSAPIRSLLLCLLVSLGLLPIVATAANLERGAEVYAANCATCHGPAGWSDPDSPLVKGLGVVPADFSDALFNSREGEGEWTLVVTHGGAALGFSEVMPAFGGTLSDEDIENVLAHIKTLGGEHDYPDGALNLFLPIRTKKAFPEDEWVWKQRYTDQEGDNAWKNTLEYEFRLGQRWQGILEATHTVKGDDAEFGHFEPGFKYVLSHDKRKGSIYTVAAQVGVPLNSDEPWEFLPYLAMGKIINDEWTFQGSARLKLDLEDSDHSSAEFAGIVHWVHTPWPRSVFPGLEFIAEVPFERGTGPAKVDAVQFSVLPQVRIGISKRGHVAVNVGAEIPLNERDRYDWRAYVYLIWDFADGGFFEAW